MTTCREKLVVIVVLDEAHAHRELHGRRLSCSGCGHSLRPWGYARGRWVRQARGGRTWLQPARGRCTSCQVTRVLLPAYAPARSAYSVEVVGEAIEAYVGGEARDLVATTLDVPADTVRGWLRRFRARASWLATIATTWAYKYDPMYTPRASTGSVLVDALSALGDAAAATRRLLGTSRPTASLWELVMMVTRGQLLVPLPPSRPSG